MTHFHEILARIENFGHPNPSYWGNALSGEVGEVLEVLSLALGLGLHSGNLSNLVKKFDRDSTDTKDKMKEEVGGTFIYLALLCEFFGIDFEQAILDTTEAVAIRREEEKDKVQLESQEEEIEDLDEEFIDLDDLE